MTADAYPGRVFPGRVYEMRQTVGKRKVKPEDPAKIQDMKVLEIKIEITEGGDELTLDRGPSCGRPTRAERSRQTRACGRAW